jgi:hypothetical protein
VRVSKRVEIILNHGDLYVMIEKTTGHDWKLRKTTILHQKMLIFDIKNKMN